MEPQKTKKRSAPGQIPLTAGIALIVLGGLFAVLAMASTSIQYVAGEGRTEVNGTPSVASIVMIIAGVILASLGYLKKR